MKSFHLVSIFAVLFICSLNSWGSSCAVYVSTCQQNFPLKVWTADNYQNSSVDQLMCMQRANDYEAWCGANGAQARFTSDSGTISRVQVSKGKILFLTLPAGHSYPLVNYRENPNARLSMQTDGNFVLYAADGTAYWNSQTQNRACNGCRATFQSDGNLVLYDAVSNPFWNSGSQGAAGATLTLTTHFPYLTIRRNTTVSWSSSPLRGFEPLNVQKLGLSSSPEFLTQPLIINSQSGVVVRNKAIGNSRHDGPCLMILNSDNVIIEQSEIFNCSNAINQESRAIYIYNSRNITIRKSYIHSDNSKDLGIEIYNSDNVAIEHNQFFRTAGGVVAQHSRGVRVYNNRFYNMNQRGNAVPYSSAVAASIGFVQFYKVSGSGNQIHCNQGKNDESIALTGDLININESNGESYSPISVYGNRIENSLNTNLDIPGIYSAGIQTGDGSFSSHISVAGNTIVNVGGGGLGVSGGYKIQAYDNRVYSSRPSHLWTMGIYAQNYYGGNFPWSIPGAFCDDVRIFRNSVNTTASQQPGIWTDNLGANPLCSNVYKYANTMPAAIDRSALDAVAPGCPAE